MGMISNQPASLFTGNEYISLPEINSADCGIQTLGFMSESFRGCVEMSGTDRIPLISPFVEIDGRNILTGPKTVSMLDYWIPRFQTVDTTPLVTYTVVSPIARRGFAAVLEFTNHSNETVNLCAGWRGCWSDSSIVAGQAKLMHALKRLYLREDDGTLISLEFTGQTPLYAISLRSSDCSQQDINCGSASGCESYSMSTQIALAPGETRRFDLYVGIGLEEVSASASSRELELQGSEKILNKTREWLADRTIGHTDPVIKSVINLNSFYNFFYCQAITLDTEEFIVTTTRSTTNDFCGAYRDRDAMRWSLPAVLQVSWSDARRMLIYGLTRQLNNVGMHSRFIDGIALEPGLQLDQLCAPIRALDTYVDLTDDLSLLFDRRVQSGINRVQQVLADQRHPTEALFETLLLPSGEYARLPYVCYSNVLVCRILEDIAVLYNRIRDMDRSDEASLLARTVKESILGNFIVDGPFGRMFAHSIDLEGAYEFGDDIEGSLQLLTYLNFCKPDDPVYLNTVKWIHSEHNPKQSLQDRTWNGADDTGYSILSAANDLLADRGGDILEFLRYASLDNGIAGAFVDRNTGQVLKGNGYASGAGYLAFAIRRAVNGVVPATAIVVHKKKGSPNESLYHPPPRANLHTRKARM